MYTYYIYIIHIHMYIDVDVCTRLPPQSASDGADEMLGSAITSNGNEYSTG